MNSLTFGPWPWVYVLCGIAGGVAFLGMWWLPTAQASPPPTADKAARAPEHWGVSSNGAENWDKAFSLLDSLGAHVYVRVYGTP
jgi:hypothetical protein